MAEIGELRAKRKTEEAPLLASVSPPYTRIPPEIAPNPQSFNMIVKSAMDKGNLTLKELETYQKSQTSTQSKSVPEFKPPEAKPERILDSMKTSWMKGSLEQQRQQIRDHMMEAKKISEDSELSSSVRARYDSLFSNLNLAYNIYTDLRNDALDVVNPSKGSRYSKISASERAELAKSLDANASGVFLRTEIWRLAANPGLVDNFRTKDQKSSISSFSFLSDRLQEYAEMESQRSDVKVTDAKTGKQVPLFNKKELDEIQAQWNSVSSKAKDAAFTIYSFGNLEGGLKQLKDAFVQARKAQETFGNSSQKAKEVMEYGYYGRLWENYGKPFWLDATLFAVSLVPGPQEAGTLPLLAWRTAQIGAVGYFASSGLVRDYATHKELTPSGLVFAGLALLPATQLRAAGKAVRAAEETARQTARVSAEAESLRMIGAAAKSRAVSPVEMAVGYGDYARALKKRAEQSLRAAETAPPEVKAFLREDGVKSSFEAVRHAEKEIALLSRDLDAAKKANAASEIANLEKQLVNAQKMRTGANEVYVKAHHELAATPFVAPKAAKIPDSRPIRFPDLTDISRVDRATIDAMKGKDVNRAVAIGQNAVREWEKALSSIEFRLSDALRVKAPESEIKMLTRYRSLAKQGLNNAEARFENVAESYLRSARMKDETEFLSGLSRQRGPSGVKELPEIIRHFKAAAAMKGVAEREISFLGMASTMPSDMRVARWRRVAESWNIAFNDMERAIKTINKAKSGAAGNKNLIPALDSALVAANDKLANARSNYARALAEMGLETAKARVGATVAEEARFLKSLAGRARAANRAAVSVAEEVFPGLKPSSELAQLFSSSSFQRQLLIMHGVSSKESSMYIARSITNTFEASKLTPTSRVLVRAYMDGISMKGADPVSFFEGLAKDFLSKGGTIEEFEAFNKAFMSRLCAGGNSVFKMHVMKVPPKVGLPLTPQGHDLLHAFKSAGTYMNPASNLLRSSIQAVKEGRSVADAVLESLRMSSSQMNERFVEELERGLKAAPK